MGVIVLPTSRAQNSIGVMRELGRPWPLPVKGPLILLREGSRHQGARTAVQALWGLHYILNCDIDGKAEAQRGIESCPESHSPPAAKQLLALGP